MSVIGSNIIAGASGTVETGYQIARSLRFNSADSANLTRTPASAGNRKTWTWSGWVKRGSLGATTSLFGTFFASNDSSQFYVMFNTSNQLAVGLYTAVTLVTSAVYRDVSAYYHIVIAFDSTQATASNRLRVYVNGSEVTAFATDSRSSFTQNGDFAINAAQATYIGYNNVTGYYFDGYMADVNFVDGQQLTPSSFGETDSATGVWVPKAYTGTYGTNGFWLKLDDNSNTTATTLGKDSSGNGNNWTPNNFSVTAGVGNDSLVDSPTNYGTDTGVGGDVRGNYATWNPLDSAGTPSNGNLLGDTGSTGSKTCVATMAMQSGKYYWEVQYTSGSGSDLLVGIAGDTFSGKGSVVLSNSAVGWSINAFNGNLLNNGSSTAYGVSFTTNDIISVAYDADTGKVWFAKNGTWMNSGNPATGANPATSSATAPMRPAICSGTSTTQTANTNFGQRPFAYTAPSGFKALCTQNLPTPAIGTSSTTLADDYFNIALYTGNGTAIGSGGKAVTGLGFQPDFVWIKGRSGATDHSLFDAVRGTTKLLESNTSDAESTQSESLTTFGSDGFTVGSLAQVNTNTATYVGWAWKANGAGSSNTAGSITSTVSANQTAGISVVTYTTNSTTGTATIGHGLGVAPAMIILKDRSYTYSWDVYHKGITNAQNGRLILNATDAYSTTYAPFGSVAPTSSVFTFNQGFYARSGDNIVAYCFAEVPGFSKFGSYTGNGSADGPFVFTGFRPRWIMIKRTDVANSWVIVDTVRNTYNVAISTLYAEASLAEESPASSVTGIDILSNGFKPRDIKGFWNTSGGTYIFAAFAEAPFNYARAR